MGGLLALTLSGAAPVCASATEDAAAAYGKGDYPTALRLFGPLAARGDAYAETYLGLMNANGQGLPQNLGQAIEWYRKAADQGYAPAESNLGVMFSTGQGVPEDLGQAIEWYRKAAYQGYAPAEFNLGVMFETGQGVPQSSLEAVTWYRKAADQGHVDARRRVGSLCPRGTGNQACTAFEGKSPSEIPLQRRGSEFLISVLINDGLTLDFVIDSGASDVSVPANVVQDLMRKGLLGKEDFLGSRNYKLADGSIVPAERFAIRTMKVGEREVANVTANVVNASGPLLLGQSFLTRFNSWSIDNSRSLLLLK